jgi:hypothetical protein
MDAAPMAATTPSAREERKTPDNLRTSRVPDWWSMMPTTRNRVALNSPWARSIASPASAASGVPRPTTMVRKPSWLTVPYARMSLMSVCRSARYPPTSMVARPRPSTTGCQKAVSENPGASLATR